MIRVCDLSQVHSYQRECFCVCVCVCVRACMCVVDAGEEGIEGNEQNAEHRHKA